MRPLPFCLLAGWLLLPLAAQGTVNSTILRPTEATPIVDPGADLYARIQGSVVRVAIEVDGDRGNYEFERASSGVIVHPKGLVVTLRHLVVEVEGASDKRLWVQLNDASNTRLPATIVRMDEASGLALLRVEPPPTGLSAVKLRGGEATSGERVLVVARPSGEDMLAFAGVTSQVLSPVTLFGRSWRPLEVFMTDSRNDERCDGAGVFGYDDDLLGLYASEHVQRDKSEPTLEDLQRPSFGLVVPAERVLHTFASELRGRDELPEPQPAPFTDAVRAVAVSVVSVWAGGGEWPELGAQDPGGSQRREGLGSGVVMTADGLIVTNLHVVKADGAVRVRTLDGMVLDAEVVRRDASANLALLRATLPKGKQLRPAACAADDDVLLGEAVIAVGNPIGTGVVATAGVVSAMREREGGRIQADANLGNQNGGGAIVDAAGRLLGIGDAGLIDPLEWAFKTRRDRVTQETNLSTFVGIQRVRRFCKPELASELVAAPAGTAELQKRATPLTRMVQQTRGALLNIYVARNVAKVDNDDPFAEFAEPQLEPMSLGSGVIIDRSGLAVSNWHVVDDATNPDGSMRQDHAVTARTFDGKEYKVRVLSISREDDLSLLQLELPEGEAVHAVELGDSEALRIGESVAAIGNPHGRANTITFGVVSAKEQGIRVKGRWAKLEHLIETDAAINGGNSGGALLDMQGRLVGINSAGGGTFNNKGYAIAVDHVRHQLLNLLFQPYKLRSPDFGMRVADDEGGVVVSEVDARGPAARADVQVGDRIRKLAGVDITWSPGFARTLLGLSPGAECPLVIERGGKAQTVTMAPLGAEVWSVVRQADLECRDYAFAEDPERVRETDIALERQFTRDPNGAPGTITSQVVRVERVFSPGGEAPVLKPGDLILAVELRNPDGKSELRRLDGVRSLRDTFNERELGSYEGTLWPCWIARGSEVLKVEVLARRLFW